MIGHVGTEIQSDHTSTPGESDNGAPQNRQTLAQPTSVREVRS